MNYSILNSGSAHVHHVLHIGIITLCLFISLPAGAQENPHKHDTIVLNRLFHAIGQQIKKTAKSIRDDSVKRRQFQEIQTSNTLKLGVTINFTTSDCDDILDMGYLVPSLAFHYKRNIFMIGPKLQISDIEEKMFDNPGIEFSYQLNPFKEHRFLNFYLAYNWGYLREKHNYTTTVLQGATTSLVPSAYITHSIGNTIGYGIRLNITKGLFLYQNWAMGFVWNKQFYKYGNPVFDSGYRTEIEKGSLLTAGLGYRF